MASFPERLKMLRHEKKLSQQAFSKDLRIPRTTIASWEAGSRIPELISAQRISDYFGVSIDYLLGRIDIRNPIHTKMTTKAIYKIIQDDLELADFIAKLTSRSELQLVSKQLKDLPNEMIWRISKIIEVLRANYNE